MSEQLKARFVTPDATRSKDALVGVDTSPYQPFVERSTVGPFYNGQLDSEAVLTILSNPSRVLVIGCGRNEHRRGNLAPNLKYMVKSTGGRGNVLYMDADSTDGSFDVARSLGVETRRRADFLPEVVNTQKLADILAMSPETLEGQEKKGDPPLRKGADILGARIDLYMRMREGKMPEHVIYSDTDLKSIPGGQVAGELKDPEQIYYPLHLVVAGLLNLNSQRKDGKFQWAVYTGSEGRNNEPINAMYNSMAADATNPFLNDRQREIAHAYFILPGSIVHPLTGELIVASEIELASMGATGQCVETARNLSLVGGQLAAYGTTSPEALQEVFPLVGNVRRGKQLRIDEPQLDEKEWWMITGVIPQFGTVIMRYSIHTGKLPQEFDLDDYAKMNRWLAGIQDASQINNGNQTRQFDRYPSERVIPPVAVLAEAGLLKI